MKLLSKSRFKSLLSLTLTMAFFLLFASGCNANGNTNQSASQGTKLRIVTSIFAPYDFSRQIVGEAAEVSMLIPPGFETHSYEPTPRDIAALQNADIFIYVGGESDAWLEDIIASIDSSKLQIIRLIDLVPTLDEVLLEGMQEEQPEPAVDGNQDNQDNKGAEPDEHVWTSVDNAQLIAWSLADSFSLEDPENSGLYQQNVSAYLAELQALDARFKDIVDNSKRKTIVFGDRFPFRYFASQYGLECFAAFSGCSTAVDTNPQTIKFLIDKVKQSELPAVFYIELSSHRIADAISEATGAQELELHACHNISKQDFDSGVSYIELMNRNADNLRVALN